MWAGLRLSAVSLIGGLFPGVPAGDQPQVVGSLLEARLAGERDDPLLEDPGF
jgi:hypothetical protein